MFYILFHMNMYSEKTMDYVAGTYCNVKIAFNIWRTAVILMCEMVSNFPIKLHMRDPFIWLQIEIISNIVH